MTKALVVDDSRAIRTILTKTLTGCGFEVSQAANGLEALQIMEREVPEISLVLADWNMPEMDGLEFVKKMRSDDRFASVLVMMVTTETHTEQMLAALDAGANEYIMKPFTKEMIADKLRLMGVLQ
jgi:two-component system, chemotaxis family, chemotaxis protein CheY